MSTKLWRGYIFIAVCLCVSLSVCLSVNKIPTKQMHRFGRGFRLMAVYGTGSDPIEIGDLVTNGKVTVTQYLFSFHNSLLTSLLSISALFCPIKMNLVRYCALSRFEFHKNRIVGDIIVTLFTFSQLSIFQILLNQKTSYVVPYRRKYVKNFDKNIFHIELS